MLTKGLRNARCLEWSIEAGIPREYGTYISAGCDCARIVSISTEDRVAVGRKRC